MSSTSTNRAEGEPTNRNNTENETAPVNSLAEQGSVENENKGERMYFNYGDEMTKPHTILVNGARVNAEPLVLPRWIDTRGSEMKQAEEKVAVGADLEDETDLQSIHEQLEKSKLEGKTVNCLAAIFREYGDQVAIANREIKDGEEAEKSGMDPWKLGNQVDFNDPNNLVLIISEGRKDKMLGLLENPPQSSVGDLRMNFRMGPPLFEQNYFASEEGRQDEKELGFTARITYTDKAGKEVVAKKLFFLLAQSDSEARTGGQKPEQNESREASPQAEAT